MRKILQRSVDGPPEPARGQLGVRRRFVDWNNASNFERLNFRSLFRREIAVDIEHLELRLLDLQSLAFPVSLHFAVERYQLARLEAVTQILAVEPYTAQRSASLSCNHLENRNLFCSENGRVADLGDYGCHLAWFQLANTARVQPVFIAKRQIVEQVFHRADVLLRQPFGHARPYAFHELDFRMELQHRHDDKSAD